MAVAKLAKLLIVTHKSDENGLLKALQKKAIAEIIPYISTEKKKSSINNGVNNSKSVSDIKKAIDILDNYKDKTFKKIAARAGKYIVKKSEYSNIIKRKDFDTIMKEVVGYDEEIRNNEAKIIEINTKIKQLQAWRPFKWKIEDLKNFGTCTIKLAQLRAKSSEVKKILNSLTDNHISYEIINKNAYINYLILAYHNAFKKEVEEYLAEVNFEYAELDEYTGTVESNLDFLQKSLEYCEERKEILVKLLREINIKSYRDLVVYLDYLENNSEVEEAIDSNFPAENASFYITWVTEKNKNKVFSLVDNYKSSKVYEIKPDKDEETPIILENKPIFKPFEIIISLYGVPKYFEIDPTPYVSLFFALFFGLCITDAGYGVIFLILSALMFLKFKGSKKMALLVLFMGIFTVIAGALFNGWFGDLPSYLGREEFFGKFALLGDPMKSESGAMNFFRLALLLGVLQVIFGLFIRFFDSIGKKNFQVAFLDTLPWMIIIISLVIILLSSNIAVSMQIINSPIFPASVSKVLIWLILPSAIVILLFSARDQKSWGFRLFMGFLNLTIVNGITSYMGDFLSYIRLMALGLVTAGIGVAINRIAFDFGSIPVIGIIILIIGLVFGHIFNMGINILGGFVHTLRLQYVEFFSKFYEGGGRPFKELKEEHKYIILVD
ncbi:MAG: V-type ATP synthase subunit I [Actinobacteria bacterium ADurb.Bin346]|nr:MAG: V-type ATP synthase subunit I [Actinobacteria bacterium ADurb.Bin346]